MNCTRFQVKQFSMAAIGLVMLAAVVVLAGIAVPALAQTYPVHFPGPTTFLVNNDVGGSISAVQAAVVGDFNNDGKLDVVSMENPGGYFEIDVALGNGDGTFQPVLVQNLFPGNQHTHYAMAVGDFNGDGNLDLAVWGIYAPNNASEVMIFLGNGNGTFTYSNTYTAPNSSDYTETTNSLYVADFNGDGHLDLAALTQYNGVYIYLGKGDGTFQTAVGYSTVDPNHPNNYIAAGMAVGDLNGDGKPDIAVTESTGMAVLLNNGNGTFGTATYYDSGTNASSEMGIAIGDVNGDKKNDIVITSWPNGEVLLYLNQGSGKFAVPTLVATLGVSSWLVTIADINGDKKMDLVVTDWVGEVWIFYGKGNGTFTAGPCYPLQYWEDAPSNVILADFNGDGALDLFKAGDHYLYGQVTLGRGDGTFQTNQAYGWGVTGFGQNLVTADFNGDGFPDVAFSWADVKSVPAFGVMLGSSHGALAAPTYVTYLSITCSASYPAWIATGDVNGDGKADIVATINNYQNTGCPMNEVAVFTGLGTGKFNPPVFYSTGASVQSTDVFLADVNGDGHPDIVISNADGTISVLLNKGKGTFGTATLITSLAALSPHLNALAIADFNGDGKLDIAAASYYPGSYSNNVYILLGNGDGTFQAPITVAAGPQYSYTNALAAGDFNKDGKMDLLVTLEAQCSSSYHGSAAYAYLQGKGDGTFTASSPVCTGGDYPIYPVVGDFNGDGKLDAVIPMLEQYGSIQGPVVLQGNGDGTFNRIGDFYVGSTGRGAVVADFNGDGMPDIAVLNNDTYAVVDYISFVTVMQNGSQPVSVSPLTLNFGSITVGTSKPLTVIHTNDQTTSMTISSVTVGGTDPGDFTEKSTCGSVLKAGWECTITVTAKPTVLGAQTATLSIKDEVGAQTVQLIIDNPVPGPISLSPSSALVGSGGFTLTVNGKNFVPTSVVEWAGSPRTTTYVSAIELTAVIDAADVAKAGIFRVTVTSPAPGGGTAAANFTVDNPVPTLISISPSSATHGGPAFTLTATGTNYVSGSVIEWNGVKLSTKYVSSITLTTTVPAADIKTAGTATVTVFNATPGGGASAPQTFTIK
jgi:hypothetical protein